MKEQRTLIRPLQEILADAGIGFDETSSGQLVIDSCFNCGRSKKLYVNPENGAFVCFRCDARGGPVQLLKEAAQINGRKAFELLFGKQGPQNIYQDEEDELNLPISLSGTKRTKYKTKKELPRPVPIPPYMKPLKPSDTDAWNYLKLKRGIPDDIIKELNVYHWELANRIVFLITVEGKVYGTLARDYMGDAERKVLNSSGGWRSFTVWNYDLAKESDELVICEGAFSAIKCGIDKSIALFGKTATPGQIEVIRSTRAKKLYICLDVGTDKEQNKLVNQLSIYYPGKIFKIELPHVIQDKNTTGKQPLCDKVNKAFNTSLSFESSTGLYHMKYSDKEQILEAAHVHPKMTTEERLSQFNGHIKKHFKSIFSEKELTDLRWLIFSAEYKDSGDYSFDEMDEYIKKAKPFKGGPMSW